MLPKYFDTASTTPVDQEVLSAMAPYFVEIFGNASSIHSFGVKSKNAIDLARQQVADIISASSNDIYFTSGATEAINWAIKGYLEENLSKGNHIITVKTEHKAVLSTCSYLETKGYEVTYLGVDENGLLDLEELEFSIKSNTVLICIMYVNNEIGVIQDFSSIINIKNKYGITLFCDATQAIGKVPINIGNENIDMLSISAHKFNGPKGVGALYIKPGIKLTPLMHGGPQERGLRAGTYNTPLIVGFGKICELTKSNFISIVSDFEKKRSQLEKFILDGGLGYVNFNGVRKSPHILSVTLFDKDADDFLLENHLDFVASTGSACNARVTTKSHVLMALNRPNFNQIIRFSF